MKKKAIVFTVMMALLILVGCGMAGTVGGVSSGGKDTSYFEGKYVLESVPDADTYYAEVVFFKDGKCCFHRVMPTELYGLSEYSYSPTMRLIGIGTPGLSSFGEMLTMSEDMETLSFSKYDLKLEK